MPRTRTCLIGLSVGDAFGETMFGDPADSARRSRERELSPRRPWRWTDDTAMAISVVEVLEAYGAIDPDALAAAFARRWAADPDRGYGNGAFQLLHQITLGADWRSEARAMFDGQGSFGNGAAMRAAPIGACFAGDLERVVVEARRSAEPTHTHADGIAGAVAVAVAAALAATDIDRSRLIAEVAARTPPGETLDRLRAAASMPLDAHPSTAASRLGTGREIAAHDTVPYALWCAARHLDSYEDALWTATMHVGDRDTLGAIVGGIVALRAPVPATWIAATEPLLTGPSTSSP